MSRSEFEEALAGYTVGVIRDEATEPPNAQRRKYFKVEVRRIKESQ